MKKWLWAFVVVLSLTSGRAFAQIVTVQSSVTLNAGTQVSNPINLVGTGTTSFTFTWNTTGTVSAGACRLEWSNVSGPPWTQLLAPVTVTASGGPSTAIMVVNYARFDCTTPITGTGSVQFRYVGTMAAGATGTGQDVNITNPSLVVTQSNAANLNATVTGTITANAGTGFGVAQGSATAGQTGSLIQCAVTTAAPAYTNGQTSPCSLDTTGGLRVSGLTGGGGLAQGSATGGQLGTLIQGAVTTAAPTYTTGTTNPFSMDTTGALRVNVTATVGGGAGGGTSSNFTAAFPAAGTAAGFSDGTNMQGARVFDVNSGAGLEYVQGVNLRLTGAAGSVEFGTATAPIRTDPTGTTAQPVTGSGNFTVVQPTGTNLHAVMDAGSTTAVTQATAANLNATVVQPTGTNLHVVVDSAPTTAVTGTVTVNAGTGFTVAQGSTTAGQVGNLIQGAVTTAAPSYTNGQTSPLSLDTTGALRVNGATGFTVAQGSTTAGQTGALHQCAATTAAPTYTNATTNPCSMDLAGNLRVALPGTISTNLATIVGTGVDVNTGNASAGTQRFVLATNQPNLTTPLNVALPGTSAFNLTQIGTQSVVTAANGVLRVAIADSNNQAILATADPCSGSNVATFTTATTSTTPVALVTLTAGQTIYICGIHIQGNTANDVVANIIEGTSTDCTTGTPTALDGSTTVGNGFRVAGGGGGFTSGFGGATVYKTPSTGRAVCGSASTTDRVIFSGTFIKQ